MLISHLLRAMPLVLQQKASDLKDKISDNKFIKDLKSKAEEALAKTKEGLLKVRFVSSLFATGAAFPFHSVRLPVCGARQR